MRLYVTNYDGERVYIHITANTRWELEDKLNSKAFKLKGERYEVAEVQAEHSTRDNDLMVGVIVGGCCGILMGPLGFMFGVIFGGCLGLSTALKDEEKAKLFNRSR